MSKIIEIGQHFLETSCMNKGGVFLITVYTVSITRNTALTAVTRHDMGYR